MENQNSSPPTLTPDQRELIRNYMLSYAWPSGAALTIIGAILGFVASRYTESAVNAKFFDLATKQLEQITSSSQIVAVARTRSELLADEFANLVKSARSAKQEIDSSKEGVDAALKGTIKAVNGNFAQISAELADKPAFKSAVIEASQKELVELRSRIESIANVEIVISKSEYRQQDVRWGCPSGTKLISAACVGNNGSLQAAVGPDIQPDGQFMCYRYGPTVMPVQATAVCLKEKR